MQLDIERGAGLTVRETEEEGPYVVDGAPTPGSARQMPFFTAGSAAGGVP